jgi:ADP-ribosylglycohydrolase
MGGCAACAGHRALPAGARPRGGDAGPAEEAAARLGLGWTGEEAVAIAAYAALTGGGASRGGARAANHDGDSDSTAAIAGQLWGAAHGAASLPHAWARRLDVLDELLGLAASWSGLPAVPGDGPAGEVRA